MSLDQRLANLDRTIELQQQSLEVAQAKKQAGRGTELAVQRFRAEVRKNQSEKLIVRQEIVEVENRINFLVNRFPQPVERMSAVFFDLDVRMLSVGVPAQLLQNRPDIRQAEREMAAAGLDVLVARAHFFPRVDITGGVGYQAFNLKYLFWTPDALIGNVAGTLVAPLINKKAIRAEYQSANARQLESVYNYQRVVLNAFTEVVNRVSAVANYSRSIEIKKQQLQSLEASVEAASKLFQAARAEYIEVLFAQRDLQEARAVLIETKQQQLSAIVNTYQALGGGDVFSLPTGEPPQCDR
jgi:outer membrane protein TolC